MALVVVEDQVVTICLWPPLWGLMVNACEIFLLTPILLCFHFSTFVFPCLFLFFCVLHLAAPRLWPSASQSLFTFSLYSSLVVLFSFYFFLYLHSFDSDSFCLLPVSSSLFFCLGQWIFQASRLRILLYTVVHKNCNFKKIRKLNVRIKLGNKKQCKWRSE